MSPEELKQVIVKLQVLLEEKTRNADKTKTIEKVKPGSTEKVKPGGVSNDEIMKRLDVLTMQVEELGARSRSKFSSFSNHERPG